MDAEPFTVTDEVQVLETNLNRGGGALSVLLQADVAFKIGFTDGITWAGNGWTVKAGVPFLVTPPPGINTIYCIAQSADVVVEKWVIGPGA